ncbi:MAG: hypothetical protein M1830_006501 [Pleopsidium flavum]|nr:MAG: hypothetical protein M1830_006501 [Pleopsidium flavum]
MRNIWPCYGGCEHYHLDLEDLRDYADIYDEQYDYDDLYDDQYPYFWPPSPHWEIRGPCTWCRLWRRYWPHFEREPFYLEIEAHFIRIHKHFDHRRPLHPVRVAKAIRNLAEFMLRLQHFNDRGLLVDKLIRRLDTLALKVLQQQQAP